MQRPAPDTIIHRNPGVLFHGLFYWSLLVQASSTHAWRRKYPGRARPPVHLFLLTMRDPVRTYAFVIGVAWRFLYYIQFNVAIRPIFLIYIKLYITTLSCYVAVQHGPIRRVHSLKRPVL